MNTEKTPRMLAAARSMVKIQKLSWMGGQLYVRMRLGGGGLRV